MTMSRGTLRAFARFSRTASDTLSVMGVLGVPSGTSTRAKLHWSVLACAAILVLAAWIRLTAARTDLWLDELVSLHLALQLPTPLHAITVLHDNNHVLNTSWLSFLGAGRSELSYRLPNVAAGIAIVVLGWALTPASPAYAKLVSALVLATSMLLVTHTSEARGYGPAIACVLAALLVLQRGLAGAPRAWLAPLFWLCCVLGVLWHLSAAMGYAALLAYWLAARRHQPLGALSREALRWHFVPVAALFAQYLLFTRRLKIGGGHELTVADTVSTTAAWTLGVPVDPSTRWLALASVAGVTVLALRELWRARDPRWVLYASGLLFPVLTLLAAHIPHSAPRYLLFSVTFFSLLLGHAASLWIARGGPARFATLALLALSLVLNTAGDLELIRLGRGSYHVAVSFLLEHGSASAITVTSDHDFRNGLLLAHYAAAARGGARIQYLSSKRLPAAGSEWLILHRNAGDSSAEPPAHFQLAQHAYDKRLALPCATTSGMSWYVYRRRAPAAANGSRSTSFGMLDAR